MIPLDVVLQGGAVAMLGGVAWLIFTGRLVPRRTLLDVQAERDRWCELAEKLTEQNRELLVGVRVARDVIQVLPDAAGERA